MPKFKFIAIDNDGKERRGMVEAPSRQLATKQIRGYGLLPAKVNLVRPEKEQQRVGGAESKGPKRPVKRPMYFGAALNKRALAEFTRKLATLLQAGLTLLRSLEVLIDQERNVIFRWILSELADSIRSGGTFSESLAKFPKEFDFLYVNMTRAGEASGMLDVSLARLATYLEKTQRMKARLTTAMTYPTVVTVLSALIVLGLMIFVVPGFEEVFRDQFTELEMPVLTVYVLGVSHYLIEFWYLVFGGAFGLYLLWKLVGMTDAGRAFYDWVNLHLVGVGELTTKIYVIRFCRTLGTLIESSVPILEALRITRDTCGNTHVVRAVEKVHNKVKDGDSIAHTLAATGIFPSMVPSMIEVGEETGDLPEMLIQIAEVYDEEVENAIASLTSLIQPLMIVGLAIAVVLIVLALFLPFITILQSFA